MTHGVDCRVFHAENQKKIPVRATYDDGSLELSVATANQKERNHAMCW